MKKHYEEGNMKEYFYGGITEERDGRTGVFFGTCKTEDKTSEEVLLDVLEEKKKEYGCGVVITAFNRI
jgi:hypothetical protein